MCEGNTVSFVGGRNQAETRQGKETAYSGRAFIVNTCVSSADVVAVDVLLADLVCAVA